MNHLQKEECHGQETEQGHERDGGLQTGQEEDEGDDTPSDEVKTEGTVKLASDGVGGSDAELGDVQCWM